MTSAEYKIKVAGVKAWNSRHVMLPLFMAGQTKATEILVNLELKKMGQINRNMAAPAVMAATSTKIEPENEPEPETLDDPNDPKLARMRQEIGSLFGERAALSNQIILKKSKGDRAALSDDIQAVQRKIGQKMRDIRRYKLHGDLPEGNEKYPVPRDPFLLAGLIDSLRSSISRKKKDIEEMRAQDLTKPATARKLETAETKLRDLKKHLDHATTAKKQAAGVQPA